MEGKRKTSGRVFQMVGAAMCRKLRLGQVLSLLSALPGGHVAQIGDRSRRRAVKLGYYMTHNRQLLESCFAMLTMHFFIKYCTTKHIYMYFTYLIDLK